MTKEITLTQNQTEVLDLLLAWVNDESISQQTENYKIDINNKLTMTLSGYAGTGKTTIIDQFISNCPKAIRYSTYVSAPTHKAKKVIERVTGLEGYTLQKLLGLKPNLNVEDFDINNIMFDQLNEATINEARLIIIDECGMVNEDLHDYLIKESRRYGVKILFVGDELQLPPINEEISSTFRNSNYVKLTNVIRQSESNPLLAPLNALRHDLLNHADTFEELMKNKPREVNLVGEGYEVLNESQFKSTLIEYFTFQDYKTNSDFVKYTAWTNSNIAKYNEGIRTNVYKDLDLKNNPLVVDEVLLAYNSISKGKDISIITNSEEYRVVDIESYTNEFDIPGFLVKLKSLDSGNISKCFIVSPNHYKIFLKEFNRVFNTAKKYKKWRDYYVFKNNHILLHDLRTIYRSKNLPNKDINYAYGITVHKTQGSTYENIFVDAENIYKNPRVEERKKLLYVALSRASKKVNILMP